MAARADVGRAGGREAPGPVRAGGRGRPAPRAGVRALLAVRAALYLRSSGSFGAALLRVRGPSRSLGRLHPVRGRLAPLRQGEGRGRRVARRSARASSSRCSARAAAARRRCCACWPASSAPTPAACCSTAQDITDLPPNRRKVNTIFQSYALFPHLTVRAEHRLRPPRRAPPEARDRRRGREDAGPDPDGGPGRQAARPDLAAARSSAWPSPARSSTSPQVLLLDEPLAALDLKLRQRMLIELDLIHDEVGITFLYVTHDQGEAMSLSDRIAVMNARPHRAARHAGRDLRGAAHQLRRRLHRRHATSSRARWPRSWTASYMPARHRRLPRRAVLQRQADSRPGDPVFLSVRPGEDPHLARAAGATAADHNVVARPWSRT